MSQKRRLVRMAALGAVALLAIASCVEVHEDRPPMPSPVGDGWAYLSSEVAYRVERVGDGSRTLSQEEVSEIVAAIIDGSMPSIETAATDDGATKSPPSTYHSATPSCIGHYSHWRFAQTLGVIRYFDPPGGDPEGWYMVLYDIYICDAVACCQKTASQLAGWIPQ